MDDVTAFIIWQKHLISEEKERLGLISTQNLTGSIPFDLSAGHHNKMVRYGEYSPQNPRYRTSNKLLLGIGEYEERKHMLREQRKQDYEQVLAMKKNCSQNLMGVKAVSETPNYNLKYADKCVQVECDALDEQRRNHLYTDECIQVNEGLLAEETVKQPEKDQRNVKLINESTYSEKPTAGNLFLDVGDTSAKNEIDICLLSPRERKWLEFCGSGSYNPSFYEKWFPTVNTVAERDPPITLKQVDSSLTLEQLKKRAYQDELRKQIEEKKRLEAALRERERKEEEMIAKRVEEQQLKMKMEYEREQSQRREKMEKRQYQTDASKSKEEQKIYTSSSLYEAKNLGCDEKGTELCSVKHLDKNTVSSFNKPRYCSVLETHGMGISNESCVYLNNAKEKSDDKGHLATDSGNENKAYTNEKILISDNSKCVTQSNSDPLEQNINSKMSPFNLEEKTLSSAKDCHAADFIVKSPNNLPKDTMISKDLDITQRKRPVPTPRKRLFGEARNSESQFVDDCSTSHSNTAFERKENLCDSIPIPVLEDSKLGNHVQNYKTFVDENKAKSEAFMKTEAKWQIPAVQKNILQIGENNKDKYHGRILTQLGAFRRQLQMGQLRIEGKPNET